MKNKIIILLLFLSVISCSNNKWRNIEVISPNKLDTISIITVDSKRYIFNGSSEGIPENHALIDISEVSELGDELGICWGKEGYKWKLISFYSKFEYNKLDKTKYLIQEKASIDDRGIPNHKEYFKENCVVIYPKDNIIRPVEGAELIYK